MLLEHLDYDILLHILSFLEASDLCRLQRTSRRLHYVAGDPWLWRRLALPIADMSPVPPDAGFAVSRKYAATLASTPLVPASLSAQLLTGETYPPPLADDDEMITDADRTPDRANPAGQLEPISMDNQATAQYKLALWFHAQCKAAYLAGTPTIAPLIHQDIVAAMDIDDWLLATCCRDGAVSVWDLNKCQKTLWETTNTQQVTVAVQCCLRLNMLVVGVVGEIIVISLRDGRHLQRIEAHPGSLLRTLVLSARSLFSGGEDYRVNTLTLNPNYAPQPLVYGEPFEPAPSTPALPETENLLPFLPQHRTIILHENVSTFMQLSYPFLYAASRDSTIVVYHVIHQVIVTKLQEHHDSITNFSITPTHLVSGSRDKQMFLWTRPSDEMLDAKVSAELHRRRGFTAGMDPLFTATQCGFEVKFRFEIPVWVSAVLATRETMCMGRIFSSEVQVRSILPPYAELTTLQLPITQVVRRITGTTYSSLVVCGDPAMCLVLLFAPIGHNCSMQRFSDPGWSLQQCVETGIRERFPASLLRRAGDIRWLLDRVLPRSCASTLVTSRDVDV
ncbi:hypothetical protein CAOG_02363 [Capsaspora owczarzaki ATCC 30864]|uniref:F-box domain-containing protein n=1 Tax=Capsaspora owczarzaki (strain ATCC 30864) TaxID=595528 RepID=A0A0D2WM77_CAPO3|nr:hypothetical protein CAOG_02363 [Capsaspora owczarzaki ATCC 30864]KJE91198.1 hypothetical protein CAOG_002363 [Capsaspora owczarzaki ATCC 30864]|eukprot:XP_004349113.2 hypothetical protein CAOG_02363 [Capsaspora owczarzaki ATCC 30864]